MLALGPLRPSDREAWEQLFAGYNEFYGRPTMPDGFYDHAWAKFQRNDELHALGARLDDRLVGIAHFLNHASTTSADACYLQDLFTAPEARGQGVARALIAAVADIATERGCARLYWATHESNTTARSLYDQVAENRGFIIYNLALHG